jgi:FkbM family methyltransferase
MNLRKYFSRKYNRISGLFKRKELYLLSSKPMFEVGEISFKNKKIKYSDSLGCYHSIFEIFDEQVYKFKTISKNPIIVDCGSNIGLSVMYFKENYENCTVYAFEPDIDIFNLLNYNMQELNYENVILKNEAVWIENTTLNFNSEGSLAGSTELKFKQDGKNYNVKAIKLSQFLKGKNVDFLKIDIEGGENEVIFDIGADLKNVNNLFIEYHSIAANDQMLGEILVIVKNAGFRYYIKTALEIIDYPFVYKKQVGFDLQLNIFCYR